MKRDRKAKIIATLGPATNSVEMVKALHLAGADVFRLNFSHGVAEEHERRVQNIRQVERELDSPIGILLDLQGPKFRIGTFTEQDSSSGSNATGARAIEEGQRFVFDSNPADGDDDRVCLPHPEIFAALRPGAEILVDDGKLRFEVESVTADSAVCRACVSGEISDRKGVNLPATVVPTSAMTEKDREDVQLGLQLGIDWIALSFVQRPDDLEELRELIGREVGVMAKLEKPAALERLDDIIKASDAVMVARGDLGVELPPERVPTAQKRIITRCRAAGKPVVVATQMLDSMVRLPVPTRAEASDVATAIYDVTDAVMLSAETAVGAYPVGAVSMMDRIITQIEGDPFYLEQMTRQHLAPEPTTADAISFALQSVAATLSVPVAITYTDSGFSSIRASRERPDAPILSLTPNPKTARKLALVWGVHAVEILAVGTVDEMVKRACDVAVAEGHAKLGDRIVIAAGQPFGSPGTTNLLRVARIQ